MILGKIEEETVFEESVLNMEKKNVFEFETFEPI
jgi:hypothetical protein